MPPMFPSTFSVTLLAPPDAWWAQVCLTGDIDMATTAELSVVIAHMTEGPVATVYVDVAAVTFADSTLANFFVLMRGCLPAATEVVVCRPGPMTRMILEATEVDQVVTMRDDMPLLDVSQAVAPASRGALSLLRPQGTGRRTGVSRRPSARPPARGRDPGA